MKKSFLAISTFAAIMFTACSGSTKGGADNDSIQNDTTVVEAVPVTDTLSTEAEAGLPAEAAVTEAPAQVEEKETPATKPVATEAVSKAEKDVTAPTASNVESPSLSGVWMMQISDMYDTDNNKIESSTSEKSVWEFTDKTVTVYDENDLNDGEPLQYTLSGKLLKVPGLPFSFTIVKLTETTLVLRSSKYNDSYSIFTFKRE